MNRTLKEQAGLPPKTMKGSLTVYMYRESKRMIERVLAHMYHKATKQLLSHLFGEYRVSDWRSYVTQQSCWSIGIHDGNSSVQLQLRTITIVLTFWYGFKHTEKYLRVVKTRYMSACKQRFCCVQCMWNMYIPFFFGTHICSSYVLSDLEVLWGESSAAKDKLLNCCHSWCP